MSPENGSRHEPATDQDLYDMSPPGWWWPPDHERHLHEYAKDGRWGFCRNEDCHATTYLGTDRNYGEGE